MWLNRGSRGTSVVVASIGFVAACGREPTATLSRGNFSGSYSTSSKQGAAVCAPLQLPAPTSTDQTKYAPLPVDTGVSALTILVAQTGAEISIALTGGTGQPSGDFPLTGTIDLTTGVSSTSRSANPITEAPRVGGHTFFVAETTRAEGEFFPLIGTPSGQPVGASMQNVSTSTFVFRDGGSSGTVFTTCAAIDSLAGGLTTP